MTYKFRFALLSILMTFAMLGLSSSLLADPLLSLFLPGLGIFNVLDVEEQDFARSDAWENYSSPSGARMGVENGVYRAYTPNAGYLWGLNSVQHTDVALQVDMTPLTLYGDTAAGVMCRADIRNNGDGYYFMVNGNGYFSISAGDSEGIVALVSWQQSSAIRVGLDRNVIRAVCLGNLLAMYVNDELVATVEDNRFSTGYTGLVVAAGNASVEMAFDDLIIYSVAPRL